MVAAWQHMLCKCCGSHAQGSKLAPKEPQMLGANPVNSACGFAAAAVGQVACSLASGARVRQKPGPKQGPLGALVEKRRNFEFLQPRRLEFQNLTKSRFFSAQEYPTPPGIALVLSVQSKPPYIAATGVILCGQT